MMTNGAHSGLFLSCAQCYGGLGTDDLDLWPEYSAPVGHPSAEPTKDNRTGVWSRNYSKALCLVNPANSSRRAPLPAHQRYMTLYGEPVPGGAVTLDAASGLVLLRHSHALKSDDGTRSKRHVRWYHASGAQADIAVNEAWLSRPERRAAITGAYACCNFFMFNATTGALIADVTGNYSNRFSPFLSRGLSVHAHGMMNEQALKSGAALKAIPDLARFVEANGIDGVLVDYEPLDVSVAHAKLFAQWLSAAAAAVHAIPVPSGSPRKEVGVNIADWSVVSPGLWHFYNASVDFMATMTPTYSETKRDWPFITSLTQAISPLAKIDVGVASSLQVSGPPGDHCRGAPFNTTFTDWGSCNTTNSSLKPIP